jgi:hypothetical protein
VTLIYARASLEPGNMVSQVAHRKKNISSPC